MRLPGIQAALPAWIARPGTLMNGCATPSRVWFPHPVNRLLSPLMERVTLPINTMKLTYVVANTYPNWS